MVWTAAAVHVFIKQPATGVINGQVRLIGPRANNASAARCIITNRQMICVHSHQWLYRVKLMQKNRPYYSLAWRHFVITIIAHFNDFNPAFVTRWWALFIDVKSLAVNNSIHDSLRALNCSLNLLNTFIRQQARKTDRHRLYTQYTTLSSCLSRSILYAVSTRKEKLYEKSDPLSPFCTLA